LHFDQGYMMKTDQPSPTRKVGIYERPASADRPRRGWVVWAIAIAVAVAWGVYFLWAR
jgi:hypothetical protein